MSKLYNKYFVLKPGGDDAYAWASRTAMIAYASAIRATDPELTRELQEWLLSITVDMANDDK